MAMCVWGLAQTQEVFEGDVQFQSLGFRADNLLEEL